MAKFVIEYVTDSYDSHYEHIYTMEAELKSDIQLHLLAAFEDYRLNQEENMRFIEERMNASEKNPITKDHHERYKKFLAKKPFHLNVNGYYMAPPDDIMDDSIDHLLLIEITELDKWFENAKPEKALSR